MKTSRLELLNGQQKNSKSNCGQKYLTTNLFIREQGQCLEKKQKNLTAL